MSVLARLVTLATAVAVLAGVAVAPAAADETTETTEPTGDYMQVVDIAFPADPRVTYSNSYDAPRSGDRVHKAADLMGEKGWAVHAAVGGVIDWIPGWDGSPMPSYGYMIAIDGDDGRRYSYVHMNNDTPGTDDGLGGPQYAYAAGLEPGVRVSRGQLLGWLGDSGNAESTAPHLHFEIEDPAVVDPYGSNHIDPTPSLDDARARGDYPATAPAVETRALDSACPADIADPGFADVGAGATHYRAIACAVWWELTNGRSETEFAPRDTVTRGQMAAFLARLVEQSGGTLPEVTAESSHFEDLDGTVHAEAIERLAAAEVVAGYPDGTFRPGNEVTREQMATFLDRVLTHRRAAPLAEGENWFRDDDGSIHQAAIQRVAGAGVAGGYTDATFRPANAVTREQMATFLARALALLVDEGVAELPA